MPESQVLKLQSMGDAISVDWLSRVVWHSVVSVPYDSFEPYDFDGCHFVLLELVATNDLYLCDSRIASARQG